MASVSTAFLDKAATSTLALKPDNSLLLRMSLVHFKLLLQHWSSEQVSSSANKITHRCFKRNSWVSRSLPSYSATIPTSFHSQKLWGLVFSALEPLTREPVAESGSFTFQRRPPQPRCFPQFLTATCDIRLACFVSPPLLPVCTCFLYILSYTPYIQLDFR